MNLAFITPTYYLEKYAKQGDFYLALAHLVDDKAENTYASFHRREAEKGRRIILDNGLFEGAQVDAETLLQRARAIKAQVVCAPDVLYDAAGTIKEFKRFIRLKQDLGMVIDVMGIPQANNRDDWWECFRYMDLSHDCNLIGLSILSITESFKEYASRDQPITSARMRLIRELFTYQSLLGRPSTPCHLLGLGESLADITLSRRILPNTIVSNDSSSTFVHGAQGIRYSRLGSIPGGKDHKRLDFDSRLATLEQVEDIQHNINIAKELARYKWSSMVEA